VSSYELDYLDLVHEVITKGQYRECRNGETRALFGQTLVIKELNKGLFPILTTRRIFYAGVLGELAAFLRGATKVGAFRAFGCNYWNDNAREWPPNQGLPLDEMSIGQVYGAQWVNWRQTGHNQLAKVMDELYANPHGRRHVVTSFDPLAESCLPPCHLMFQFFSNHSGKLDIMVYMRSVDLIHGLPSDVVLYAGLLILVANFIDMQPGSITFFLGDTHVYENHVKTFLEMQYENRIIPPPSYSLAPNEVFDFVPSQLDLLDYKHGPTLTYPFNV
jgi:thymidylate synthase